MAAKPLTLPKIEDDVNYRTAIERAVPVETKLKQIREELRSVEWQIQEQHHGIAERKKVAANGEPPLSLDFLNVEQSARELEDRRRQLATNEARLSVMLTSYRQGVLAKTRAAFFEQHAKRLAESTWNPAIKKLVAAWLAYHRLANEVQQLAEAFSDAGLWGGPINYPDYLLSYQFEGDPTNPNTVVGEIAKSFVREGYLSPRDLQ